MYRSIDTKIWSDPKFRSLNKDERTLFIYLITNQHTHLSGIYYLPIPLAVYETGLTEKEYRRAIDTLSKTEIAEYDDNTSVIWVVNMFKYQSSGSKSVQAAKSQLQSLHNSRLILRFVKHYNEIEWGINTLSIPNQYPIPQEQEQNQNQERDQEQEQEIAANGVPPSPPTEFSTFISEHWPKIKDAQEWESIIKETYPKEFDYIMAVRNARIWCVNNPKKAPKSDYKRFLGAWIGRDYEKWRKEQPSSLSFNGKRRSSIPTTNDDSYIRQLEEAGLA